MNARPGVADVIDPRWRVGALSWSGARKLVRERMRLLSLLTNVSVLWIMLTVFAWLVSAVSPAALVVVVGGIVGTLKSGFHSGETAVASLFPEVLWLGAIVALTELANAAQSALEPHVAREIDGAIRSKVRIVAGKRIPFEILESTEFHDDVVRACDPGATARNRTAGAAAVGQGIVLFRVLGAICVTIVIALTSVLLALFMLLGSLAMRVLLRRQWIYLAELEDLAIRDGSDQEAIERLITGSRSAREFRVFTLANWFIERWDSIASAGRARHDSAYARVIRQQDLTSLISFVLGGVGCLVPSLVALNGQIGLEELARCLVAVPLLFTISYMGYEAWDIDYGLRAAQAFQRILVHDAESSLHYPFASEASEAGVKSAKNIRFDSVTFNYPGSDHLVLNGLDFEIHAGETLGIVGVNGAGKTTLVKLLAGLYSPARGAIYRDGERLPGIARDVAVLYQDFLRYPLTVRENIAMGGVDGLKAPDDDTLVRECADLAGLTSSVLVGGVDLDTPLWRTDGGRSSLSGGQWQRLALARALYASKVGRSVIIMDEPTAQLDVHAERRFNEQVLASLSSVTVVLITHRLSTVRHADRILYLDDGRIAESGTHRELLSYNGRYAKLFRLQAERFSSDVDLW